MLRPLSLVFGLMLGFVALAVPLLDSGLIYLVRKPRPATGRLGGTDYEIPIFQFPSRLGPGTGLAMGTQSDTCTSTCLLIALQPASYDVGFNGSSCDADVCILRSVNC